MVQNNQPRGQTGQPIQGSQPGGQPYPEEQPREGGYPGGAQQPVSEMAVSTPTLQWISVGHPQEPVPIGPDDYVLDSVYNHQFDCWEVLVLVRPDGSEEEEEEEEE